MPHYDLKALLRLGRNIDDLFGEVTQRPLPRQMQELLRRIDEGEAEREARQRRQARCGQRADRG